MTNIQNFIIEAKANGGGSYSLNTGKTNPNKGYMVSIEGCEEIHKEIPTDESIREYILTHSEQLAMDNKYLGIWYNDKKQQWYLDVSINIDDRDKARLFGSINKQEAIWDCANGKEIKLADSEYKFARRCSYCFEGMNAGWIVDDGDAYIKHEETALAVAKSKGHNSIEEAYEHDEMYYTEWTTDEDEYYVSNKPDGSFAWLVTQL